MSEDDDSDVDNLGYPDEVQKSSKRKTRKRRALFEMVQEKKRAMFTSDQSHAEIAEIYDEKSTKEGTKNNYRSRINVLKEYLEEFSPDELDDNGEVIIPLV